MNTIKILSGQAFRSGIVMSLLLVFGLGMPQTARADEYFTYSENDNTVISGLTEEGKAQTTITIPASVTKVLVCAFSDGNIQDLYIEGNPVFEIDESGDGAFYGVEKYVKNIDCGNTMSDVNIKQLIKCLGTGNSLETLYIGGYTLTGEGDINWDEYDEDDMGAYLSSNVRVIMPATLVGSQVFGDAKVYGRITLEHDLITFCCRETLMDDGNSNMLFYRAVDLENGSLHIKRVNCIVGGQGVLIHNATNSATYADLKRAVVDVTYESNMLKGVLEPTKITSTTTVDNVEYTNMILYEGTFYPTSGGTLGANRAYLQVKTSDLASVGSTNLSLIYDNTLDEDGIEQLTSSENKRKNDGWYSIAGQRVNDRPSQPGLYVHDGHLEIIK